MLGPSLLTLIRVPLCCLTLKPVLWIIFPQVYITHLMVPTMTLVVNDPVRFWLLAKI